MENIRETVLITGGSGGIGKEITRYFLKNNFDVIIVSLSEEELDECNKVFNDPGIDYWCHDLGKSDSAEILYERCHEEKRKIDVLINNAGFGLFNFHYQHDLKRLKSMMMLNMNTLTLLCHLFGKDMVEAGAGSIINIASTSAFQPLPYLSAYAASKSFVVNFTAGLVEEMEPLGVRIICVCPGTTKTAFLTEAGLSEQNAKIGSTAYIAHKIAMDPRKVAGVVWKAYQSNRSFAVAGLANQIHFWATRIIPKRIFNLLVSAVLKK